MNHWKKNDHYLRISSAALSSRTSSGEEGKATGNPGHRKNKIRQFLRSDLSKDDVFLPLQENMRFLVLGGLTWGIRSKVAAKNKYDVPWDQFCMSLCSEQQAAPGEAQTWKVTAAGWKEQLREYLYRI